MLDSRLGHRFRRVFRPRGRRDGARLPDRVLRFSCLLAAAALSLVLSACFAGERDEQRKVVRTFLEAYTQRNMPRIRECVPKKPENLFGGYPFAGFPTLSQPKVDAREALIEFAGATQRSSLPPKGGLLCYRENGVWKVRQVLFYEKLPGFYRLPERSITTDDQRQEADVAAMGKSFLKAWQCGDTAALLARSYDWTQRHDRPIPRLRTTTKQVTVTQAGDRNSYAVYEIKMTYKWGIFRYSVTTKGGLFLVREEDDWKVRGNVMVFDF